MFSILVLHLCLNGTAPCEDRKLDLYQSVTYCQKAGMFEAAKVATTFPKDYVITRYTCNGR